MKDIKTDKRYNETIWNQTIPSISVAFIELAFDCKKAGMKIRAEASDGVHGLLRMKREQLKNLLCESVERYSEDALTLVQIKSSLHQ